MQVTVDLLCQRRSKQPAWLSSSNFFHYCSVPSLSLCLLSHSYTLYTRLSLLLSYALSFWVYFPAGLCFPTHFFRKEGNSSFWLDGAVFCWNKGALVLLLPCVYLHNWFQRTPSWENYPQKKQNVTSYGLFFLQMQMFSCMFSFLLRSVFEDTWGVSGFMWNYFPLLCQSHVRLCKPRGADHGASPLRCGGDVRDPPRFEPHQRPPEAAALGLHRQRRSSPGLKHTNTDCQHQNTHTWTNTTCLF